MSDHPSHSEIIRVKHTQLNNSNNQQQQQNHSHQEISSGATGVKPSSSPLSPSTSPVAVATATQVKKVISQLEANFGNNSRITTAKDSLFRLKKTSSSSEVPVSQTLSHEATTTTTFANPISGIIEGHWINRHQSTSAAVEDNNPESCKGLNFKTFVNSRTAIRMSASDSDSSYHHNCKISHPPPPALTTTVSVSTCPSCGSENVSSDQSPQVQSGSSRHLLSKSHHHVSSSGIPNVSSAKRSASFQHLTQRNHRLLHTCSSGEFTSPITKTPISSNTQQHHNHSSQLQNSSSNNNHHHNHHPHHNSESNVHNSNGTSHSNNHHHHQHHIYRSKSFSCNLQPDLLEMSNSHNNQYPHDHPFHQLNGHPKHQKMTCDCDFRECIPCVRLENRMLNHHHNSKLTNPILGSSSLHPHPYVRRHQHQSKKHKKKKKRSSSDGKSYRAANLHRQFSLSFNPEPHSSSSPHIWTTSGALKPTTVGTTPNGTRGIHPCCHQGCVLSGCPIEMKTRSYDLNHHHPTVVSNIRSSFQHPKDQAAIYHRNYRFWDVEEWRAQIKREKAKSKERKALMIVSAVGIIIFICVSYFGTLLFLRVTKLP